MFKALRFGADPKANNLTGAKLKSKIVGRAVAAN